MHITYSREVPFGKMTAEFVSDVIRLRQMAGRLKTVMDQITAGGVTPANLETGDGAANFGVPAGSGAAFYSDIVSIKSGLDAISASILGDLDLGE
jgi:hypothetical protein